jgi:hypothetical protein
MDMVAAFNDVGSYRGAAAICGVDHKTVGRAPARAVERATGDRPERSARQHNYDEVAGLVAERVKKAHGRISAKRLLPEARAAGYQGSARNLTRLVGAPVVYVQLNAVQWVHSAGEERLATTTQRDVVVVSHPLPSRVLTLLPVGSDSRSAARLAGRIVLFVTSAGGEHPFGFNPVLRRLRRLRRCSTPYDSGVSENGRQASSERPHTAEKHYAPWLGAC